MGFSSARNLGRDISAGFSPPRRMPISEAVKKFMRVPKGAGNSVPWDPELTPYIIEPMNCLASREYDAVIFVGNAFFRLLKLNTLLLVIIFMITQRPLQFDATAVQLTDFCFRVRLKRNRQMTADKAAAFTPRARAAAIAFLTAGEMV